MSHSESANDELLDPRDSNCADVRRLMLAEDERELSEFENRRIEKHLSECPACILLLRDGSSLGASSAHGHSSSPASQVDRWAKAQVETQLQGVDWQDQQHQLFAKLGLEQEVNSQTGGSGAQEFRNETSSQDKLSAENNASNSSPSVMETVLPVAASLLISLLCLATIQQGLDLSDKKVEESHLGDVAVLEMAEDQQQLIFDSSEEGEGVLIIMATEEE